MGILFYRREFKQMLEVFQYDDSSCSSSEEDDVESLLIEFAFAPKRVFPARTHKDDLSDLECEELFRYCCVHG